LRDIAKPIAQTSMAVTPGRGNLGHTRRAFPSALVALPEASEHSGVAKQRCEELTADRRSNPISSTLLEQDAPRLVQALHHRAGLILQHCGEVRVRSTAVSRRSSLFEK